MNTTRLESYISHYILFHCKTSSIILHITIRTWTLQFRLQYLRDSSYRWVGCLYIYLCGAARFPSQREHACSCILRPGVTSGQACTCTLVWRESEGTSYSNMIQGETNTTLSTKEIKRQVSTNFTLKIKNELIFTVTEAVTVYKRLFMLVDSFFSSLFTLKFVYRCIYFFNFLLYFLTCFGKGTCCK